MEAGDIEIAGSIQAWVCRAPASTSATTLPLSARCGGTCLPSPAGLIAAPFTPSFPFLSIRKSHLSDEVVAR